MFNFVNLTPHDITVFHFAEEGSGMRDDSFTVKASGDTIRLQVSTFTPDGHPDWVKVRTPSCDFDLNDDHTVVSGVKIPNGADVIVSAQVASFLTTKGDLPFNVFTVGDTVKNEQGAIIGTKFLVLN